MSKLGKVGPYTLLERLGRGGMGEVYLAVARRGERVAIKVLRDLVEDESARIRLEREVRALRRVESPYVARVFDADLDCDRPYLVMEHIEGDTLLERVRRSGPLDVGGLVELAQGIATALAITHAAGVIHRDLKPANILMSERGPVLIDFGIAQVLDATRLTMTGTFLGTPGYTAPEIFADEQVDSPADVHAWGATVAFAATGRPTFGRGTAEAQMYAVLNGQADLKGVPVELLPLVRAALHREPAKRPTAALLADRLSRLARATASDAPGEAVAEVPPPRRRLRPGAGDDAARGRAGEEQKTPPPRARAPRVRSGSAEEPGTPVPRGRTRDEPGTPVPRGRVADPGRGRTAKEEPNTPVPRGRAADPGRGRTSKEDLARGRAKEELVRARAKEEPGVRGRVKEEPGARGRIKEEPGARGRIKTGDNPKTPVPRPRTKLAAEGRLVRSRGRTREGGATTLPAGNTALLLLAVLAVPCVVASVVYPIASIGITAALVVLTRTLWMSHWLVRNRSSKRVRVLLRVLLFPFALVGAAATAAVWPGAPVALVAGGALWATGGGEIASDWWQQVAPVTVAAVVFGVLCGGVTGREIERIGARLPNLRREGLRALAVLGGFVALCAAAVRAIDLLL
ncbi:serine/threonine protein kinase [Nonomuraea typhae]|uniref:serine/threonine protein kinase n=1 Tax=Nonomuraea typhae TaxID=2603600 RepID=UPI0012FBEC4E|nr:serine/threonine protein kinase [Nonomuraea typhae]